MTEADAKAIVERYLNDINSKDVTDATTLICAEQLQSWESNLNSANSDFNFHVDAATFSSSTATSSGGLNVKYAITASSSSGQSADVTLTFTVISESGTKICGEG